MCCAAGLGGREMGMWAGQGVGDAGNAIFHF